MSKGSKYERIALCIILSALIFTVSLVSCSKMKENHSASTADTSNQTAADTENSVDYVDYDYGVNNLIMDPLLSPLGLGAPCIIKSDTMERISDLKIKPFSDITSSDINKYYETLKSANELSSDANHILATVDGEPIYLSDIEKTKALVQLMASTGIRTMQSAPTAYEDESVIITDPWIIEEVSVLGEDEFVPGKDESETGESTGVDSLSSYLSLLKPDNSIKLNKYEGWYSISDSEYLAWLIQDKVIIQNALKSGISLSDEDIYTQATVQYELIDNGNSYMNEMTLKAYGMEKEDYIRSVLMPEMKNYDLIAMFEQQYILNNASDCNVKKNKQILKQYVDSLVAQTDVQYK